MLTNEVRCIYDGSLVLQERDGNNLPRVTYTRGRDFGGDLEAAGGIGGLVARTDNAQLTTGYPQPHAYYHADASGNITALINSNQVAVASYLYDPFGRTLAIAGPVAHANTYRFSSMLGHQSSGLLLYPFRAYDPNLHRWLTPEPYADIASLGGTHPWEKPEVHPSARNLFTFTGNNPVSSSDKDGRLVIILGPLAIAAIGAGGTLAACYLWPPCAKALQKAAADAVSKAREACREQDDRHKKCKASWLRCDSSRYPCFSCYHQCVNDGEWDSDRCPLTLSPP